MTSWVKQGSEVEQLINPRLNLRSSANTDYICFPKASLLRNWQCKVHRVLKSPCNSTSQLDDANPNRLIDYGGSRSAPSVYSVPENPMLCRISVSGKRNKHTLHAKVNLLDVWIEVQCQQRQTMIPRCRGACHTQAQLG